MATFIAMMMSASSITIIMARRHLPILVGDILGIQEAAQH
jgi:hypothetical protein